MIWEDNGWSDYDTLRNSLTETQLLRTKSIRLYQRRCLEQPPVSYNVHQEPQSVKRGNWHKNRRAAVAGRPKQTKTATAARSSNRSCEWTMKNSFEIVPDFRTKRLITSWKFHGGYREDKKWKTTDRARRTGLIAQLSTAATLQSVGSAIKKDIRTIKQR